MPRMILLNIMTLRFNKCNHVHSERIPWHVYHLLRARKALNLGIQISVNECPLWLTADDTRLVLTGYNELTTRFRSVFLIAKSSLSFPQDSIQKYETTVQTT